MIALTVEEKERSKSLYKVLVISQKIYVNSVPSFMIDFKKGLEARGWYIFDADKIKNSLKDDLYAATGIDRYPDIIVFYNAEKKYFEDWSQLFSQEMKKSVLITWADEVQHEHIVAGLRSSMADAIFARYPHATQNQLEPLQPEGFHIPHAATDNFFREIRDDKTETVLLSGAMEPAFYPLRIEASRLLALGNKSIVQRKHPGYQFMLDPEAEARSYADEISKHLIAISGGSLPPAVPAPFVLAKHFEIPAAGTALLTDEEMIPYLRELGFIPFKHYIPTQRNQLAETIAYWLHPDNRAELLEITQQGQKLVREFHRNEQRIETFNRIAVNKFHQKNSKKEEQGYSQQEE